MKKKFELKPFDKVLVRDSEDDVWSADLFSHYNQDGDPTTSGGNIWGEVIPYEGNEKLLGTWDADVPPYEPKDGDFVTYIYSEGYEYVAIYYAIDGNECFYVDLCIKNKNEGLVNIITYKNRFDRDYIKRRAATEEEKQLLLSKLHEAGKDWDAEKKEIVDWKWIPKRDDTYFYPKFDRHNGEFIVDDVLWDSMDEWFDKAHYERGWVFRSKEKCQAMCDKLNAAIKNVE